MAQTPLTILCVDDSTADRTLYRHFLGSTGLYTFLEAATGEEGLRSCQTTQPDCLILDFYLPDMDGFEFLDTLQAETVSLPYPVIILTGQGTEQLAVQAMHRGVQDYIVKDDLSAGTLRRVIANAVEDAIGMPGTITELPITPQRLREILDRRASLHPSNRAVVPSLAESEDCT